MATSYRQGTSLASGGGYASATMPGVSGCRCVLLTHPRVEKSRPIFLISPPFVRAYLVRICCWYVSAALLRGPRPRRTEFEEASAARITDSLVRSGCPPSYVPAGARAESLTALPLVMVLQRTTTRRLVHTGVAEPGTGMHHSRHITSCYLLVTQRTD